MLRLFVALELPPPVIAALLALQGGVAGARWQRADQLHLTLRFIGAADRHRVADIEAALARVRVMPFELALDAPGSFSHRGRVDSLWIGVRPQHDVAALARRIDVALQGVGLPAETRAFVPHVTLARLGRDQGSLAGFPSAPVPGFRFAISSFALWESQLGATGANYRVRQCYPQRPDSSR